MHDVGKVIPVKFEKLEEHKVKDTRFMKVKIWLMHLGENFNGSYFPKKVVEDAIPSLSNTPILAYTEPNSKGEDDASDHRRIMEKDSSGKFVYKNAGVPYGVIPENNNAQFEYKLCEDGIEREFLTVEGLLWTKWNDIISILDRDVIKNQSMELHDEYSGFMDDDGLFNFTEFKFYGACVLGIDYEPAMVDSTIQVDFELDDMGSLNKHIQDKMEQFKAYSLRNNEQQGGGEVLKEKLELLKEYSISKEEIEKLESEIDSLTIEQLKERIQEILKEDEEVDEEVDTSGVEGEEFVEPEEDEGKDKQDINIETVVVDKVEVSGVEEPEEDDVEDLEEELEKVVPEDDEPEELIGFEELQAKYNKLQEEFTSIKKENAKLVEFKDNVVKKQRNKAEEKLFKQYEVLSDLIEFEELKEKSAKFDKIEDLEKELALLFVKNKANMNFAKNDEESSISFEIDGNEENKSKRYGDLFERYGE